MSLKYTISAYDNNTTDIPPTGVTQAQMATMTVDRLLGRYTGSPNSVDEIQIGSGLNLSGAGVLTATSLGTVTSVTGTANRITSTGGTTPVIDISGAYVGQTSITTLGTVTVATLSTGAIIGGVTMTLGSDAANDIYYRNGSGVLTRLANGTTGQFLSATTGSAPSWGAPSASLTVGSSAITGGATTRILYDNAGVLGEYTITGTGTVVAMQTSPTFITPILGTPTSGALTNCTLYPIVTQSVRGTVASAGQLLGTNTNDDASAGNVGEYSINSTLRSAPTALTTATPVNIASITLTAGDWDISFAAGATSGTGTVMSSFLYAISKTSATLPATDTSAVPTAGEVRFAVEPFAKTLTNNANLILAGVTIRASISGSTTFYMVVQSAFTISTLSAYGSIWARRAR